MGYHWLLQTDRGRHTVAFERRLIVDTEALTGTIDHYPLGHGLDAFMADLRSTRDARLTTTDELPSDMLGGFVTVTGGCEQELAGDPCPAVLDRDRTAMYRPGVRRADYAFTAGTRLRALAYNIAPDRLLGSTSGEPPAALRDLLEADGTTAACRHAVDASDAIRRAAREAMDHGYAHALERMYIEARVLEIVVLQAGQLAGPDAGGDPRGARHARIRDAAALLDESLAEPPSIAALAAAAGMSEHQLQRGFRELYGRTVFAYLRDARLDAAYTALRNESIPLRVLAGRIGYSNASNFANAFRRRFGFPPGEIRNGPRVP